MAPTSTVSPPTTQSAAADASGASDDSGPDAGLIVVGVLVVVALVGAGVWVLRRRTS